MISWQCGERCLVNLSPNWGAAKIIDYYAILGVSPQAETDSAPAQLHKFMCCTTYVQIFSFGRDCEDARHDGLGSNREASSTPQSLK